MPWVKIDDNAPHHRKMLAAGPVACWLWVCGLAYCQKHSTDGAIPAEAVPFLGVTQWAKAVHALVAAGLWIPDDPRGYVVHDFLDWNDSASERAVKTESNRRRIELFRDKDTRELVKTRDQGLCRYCGIEVRWNDRRGAEGGTYDHIDPAAANDVSNLVVCCRGCNSSKGRRTPAEAGMVLLRIGSRSKSKSWTGKPDLDLGPPLPTPIPQPQPQPEPSASKNERVGGVGLVLSPIEYERKRAKNRHVGPRLHVPNVLHAELMTKLGGENPDAVLAAWYATLDAEIEASREPIVDVFKWIRPRFESWATEQAEAAEWADALRVAAEQDAADAARKAARRG